MRRALQILGVLLLAVASALAAVRVARLEASEVAFESGWLRLGQGDDEASRPGRLELARVRLEAGALATFEACFLDRLDPATWSGTLAVTVRQATSPEPMVDLPFEEGVLAYAQRSDRAACLLLAFEERVERSGEHVVEASWSGAGLPEGVAGTPVAARVLAHAELGAGDLALVALALLGGLLIAASGWTRRPAPDDPSAAAEPSSPAAPRRPLLRAGLGAALLLAVALLLAALPFGGSAGGLWSGLVLALAQVALAGLLVGGPLGGGRRARALGLARPRRAAWLVLAAPLVGGALWLAGEVLRGLVPSTSVAPLETFVSSPSGMLAVAVVAAAAPLAEELFFRGFLYGLVATRLGDGAAFAVTALLFALAHLAQDWGAWGSAAAIAVTGLALSALRWWSGSAVAPALAHLTLNGIIVSLTMAAATS